MTTNSTSAPERSTGAHSQTHEDDVLGNILRLLPRNDKWCVEFGAWDGVYLSNTHNLIKNAGYSGVLIEANKGKYSELCGNYASNSNVIPINAMVGFGEHDGLDSILAPLPIPRDFDLLSIDVDGTDYHIWKAISRYRPKLVCIEFNPTIPTEVRFVQPADPAVTHGSSLRSLVELGASKGYELVSVLWCNAVFVDSTYFHLLGIEDNRPETLRKDLSTVTYLFSGYDGTIFLHGSKQLPWHNVPISESAVQQLPKMLRKYPNNYGRFEQWAFRAYRALTAPRQTLASFYHRMTKRSAPPTGQNDH